jgi:hypothetical protein
MFYIDINLKFSQNLKLLLYIMSSLGGSTNIKTQINNLWGAIRTLNNTGSGESGNMTYVGTDGFIGRHYKQSSIDGKSCTDSKLYETEDTFYLGDNNLRAVNTIIANTFVKDGGDSSDFLKADGTIDSNTYVTSANVSGKLNIDGQM